MQLLARLNLFFPTSIIARSPGLWQRLKSLWVGSEHQIEQVRAAIEGVAVVNDIRTVLSHLGIDNARSLLIDGVTVFRDLVGQPADLPELMLALSEHASVFGPDCHELRMAVETEEAGLHLVLETSVKTTHSKDVPSAQVMVLGQRRDLSPSPGENAASYRERIDRF